MITNIVEMSLVKHGLNFEKYVELNTQFNITLKMLVLRRILQLQGILLTDYPSYEVQ